MGYKFGVLKKAQKESFYRRNQNKHSNICKDLYNIPKYKIL